MATTKKKATGYVEPKGYFSEETMKKYFPNGLSARPVGGKKTDSKKKSK